MAHGANEIRTINPVFDLDAYLKANPDVAQIVATGQTTALNHMLQFGLGEGRDLGNGVSLALFSNDPTFTRALEEGDMEAALVRAAAVTPFIPSFKAPEGWTPAANTPIPVDFVPPAGVQLVVPDGVKVPDNVTLPPFIKPPVSQPGTPTTPDTPNTPDTPAASMTFTPKSGTAAGSSDASTALALDANYMVVGDDEANVLRVYDRKGGDALVEWSFESSTKNAFGNDELDLEAGTKIGNTLYFIGSHSNKKSGAEADSREFLFAVNVEGTGKDTTFDSQPVQVRDGLEKRLSDWDTNNEHGLGNGYFGFAASAGAGIIPENVNGFSIEGMTVSLDGKHLMLGFRAPQTDTNIREKAVIIPVALEGVFDSSKPAQLGQPIELDLGGRGIRSIEKAEDGSGYLIIAGPAGPASPDVTHNFRLFTWDGTTAPKELNVDLDALRDATGGSFETIVSVPSLNTGTAIQLLQDNGDTIWAGQTEVSKDLAPGQQKFMGNWITLGPVVTEKPAPKLVKSSPADDSGNAFQTSNIELVFDQGVQRSEGNITLTTEGEEPRTISIQDTSQVSFQFNKIVINPTADLAAGKSYTVTVDQGAVKNWAGLSGDTALNFTTATPPDAYSLLITEVNSNANGGDFFELYNYGDTSIDLSGWKWTDSAAQFEGAEGLFPAGTVLEAGQALVVVKETNLDGFTSAWKLSKVTNHVISTGGPGLGGGDAVVVFNNNGFTATAFNYGTQAITASDGRIIAPVSADKGGKHAGEVVAGGTSKTSVVWDGISTANPNYITVDATAAGSVTQSDNASKGSPGMVLPDNALPRYDLLISEVNSNATGGDFFELHNHGTQSLDLTGWKWTDSSGKTVSSFAANTVIEAGGTLVVAVLSGSVTLDSFMSTWKLSADTTQVVALTGPGLGSKDGVVILDDKGKTAAGFNYGDTAFKAPDGTLIQPVPGGTGHAGESVGGNATTSAVWDGKDTVNPGYIAANTAQGASEIEVGTETALGSPGLAKPVLPKVSYDVIISEVNSNAEDGDFFELYNYGDQAIDLSGWKWTDSSGKDIAVFEPNTVLGAGDVLVVVQGVNSPVFSTNWGLSDTLASTVVFTPTGPGLGKADAVVVKDGGDNIVTSFNYGAPLPVNGTEIATSNGVTFNADATAHAGPAVYKGSETVGNDVSAVWDGVSTSAPNYVAAEVGVLGAVAHGTVVTTVGSPGVVTELMV